MSYRKKGQGEVTHIYTNAGALVASYTYDAWGKVLSVTEHTDLNIGALNPIRYRSYYYDVETGLYYLEARYYDPETGRFISQDEIDFIVPNHLTGLNLFAYCNNNPVMYSDPSGCFVISTSAIIIGAVIGAVVGLATTAVADYKEDQILFNGNNVDYLFNGMTGAITGAIGGVFANAGFALQLGVSATIGAISNVSEGVYTGEITDVWSLKTLQFAAVGAVTSAASFSLAYGITRGATRLKYQSIIGGNTSNHHINQALRAAGYANLKIGRDGLKHVIDKLSESTSIKIVNYSTGATFDFLTGVLL